MSQVSSYGIHLLPPLHAHSLRAHAERISENKSRVIFFHNSANNINYIWIFIEELRMRCPQLSCINYTRRNCVFNLTKQWVWKWTKNENLTTISALKTTEKTRLSCDLQQKKISEYENWLTTAARFVIRIETTFAIASAMWLSCGSKTAFVLTSKVRSCARIKTTFNNVMDCNFSSGTITNCPFHKAELK